MKSVIHKYPIIDSKMTLEVPAGSQILTVQLQGKVPTIWMEKPLESPINNSLKLEKRTIHVIMTGKEYEFENYLNFRYVGTVQNAGIVGHVFEEYHE